METKDLAEYYGVTRQSVEKWTVDKRKQKTIQALANADQQICDLIADISKLVFIFNCKWLHGATQKKVQEVTVWSDRLMITGTEFWQDAKFDAVDVIDQLKSIKTKLEELVYGL